MALHLPIVSLKARSTDMRTQYLPAHTCLHTYIHTYMHTCMNAYIFIYLVTYLLSYLLTYLMITIPAINRNTANTPMIAREATFTLFSFRGGAEI